jgi:hypothetical protein
MDVEKYANEMVAAVRGFVERSLAPISTRLAAVETRTGALSMIAGRGDTEGKLVEIEALQMTNRDLLARLEKSAATIESLERRASRQGDHIAKLETRVQSLEHR